MPTKTSVLIWTVAVALSGCSAPAPALDRTPAEAGIEADRFAFARNAWYAGLRADVRAATAEAEQILASCLDGMPEAERAAVHERLLEHHDRWLIRMTILAGNTNLGALPLDGRTWVDENGGRHPLVVFRSGYSQSPNHPDSLFQALLEEGQVRHVVNLYDGTLPMADLDKAEREAARVAGATYVKVVDLDYGPWYATLSDPDAAPAARAAALESLGRLIREQILAPGGAAPRGNVHVHCGGGMHRSGIVIGVLERAINGGTMDEVEARYRLHVDYQGPDRPGGFVQANLDAIADFDPHLLAD